MPLPKTTVKHLRGSRGYSRNYSPLSSPTGSRFLPGTAEWFFFETMKSTDSALTISKSCGCVFTLDTSRKTVQWDYLNLPVQLKSISQCRSCRKTSPITLLTPSKNGLNLWVVPSSSLVSTVVCDIAGSDPKATSSRRRSGGRSSTSRRRGKNS